MKTNKETSLQFANSIMPFILIGIDHNAKDEVRNGIAADLEKLLNKANESPNENCIAALKECKNYFDYMGGANHVSSRGARELTEKALKSISHLKTT